MVNPAVQALRLSSQSPGVGSKGPPGIFYRSLLATKGSKTAVKAIARKSENLFLYVVCRFSRKLSTLNQGTLSYS
jgi:hypothetical protein